MRQRFLGLFACTMVLGLGALGASGCGSDGAFNDAFEVTPDGSDISTPADGTTPEGEDEVVPPAPEEVPPAPEEAPAASEGSCSDGLDADADGAVDCADSDCSADPACSLPPPMATEDCSTPDDEDGDGQGQCSDSDCTGDPACSGGGDTWEIDPSYFDKFKEADPWPGPGPECSSCPVVPVGGYREEYHPSSAGFDKDSVLQEYKAGIREYTN